MCATQVSPGGPPDCGGGRFERTRRETKGQMMNFLQAKILK